MVSGRVDVQGMKGTWQLSQQEQTQQTMRQLHRCVQSSRPSHQRLGCSGFAPGAADAASRAAAALEPQQLPQRACTCGRGGHCCRVCCRSCGPGCFLVAGLLCALHAGQNRLRFRSSWLLAAAGCRPAVAAAAPSSGWRHHRCRCRFGAASRRPAAAASAALARCGRRRLCRLFLTRQACVPSAAAATSGWRLCCAGCAWRPAECPAAGGDGLLCCCGRGCCGRRPRGVQKFEVGLSQAIGHYLPIIMLHRVLPVVWAARGGASKVHGCRLAPASTR